VSAFDYDLVVIGAGSGGVRASRMAAGHGARVAVVECGPLGGTCVNAGCIPKKLFVEGAHFAGDCVDAAGFGWEVAAPRFHWPTLRANKDAEILRLNGVYEGLLRAAGVDIVRGRGVLAGAHRVRVDGRELTAEHVLIASGSRPQRPPWPGCESMLVSDAIFHLERFPERPIVIGGGYIAVEFASIFHGYGATTTLLHRGDRLLRGFDDGIRAFVGERMRRRGIDVRLGASVALVEHAGGSYRVTLADGTRVAGDLVLCATGRVPNVEGLGLEAAGVALAANGAVLVDADFATSLAGVHAIGDVIDRRQLTPVALAEGMYVAGHLFDGGRQPVDYAEIPTAVFCDPSIGTVGLTEAEARTRLARVRVFESQFRPLRHTLSGRDERTLMRLVVDAASDRVVGVHMAGDHAGEIVQGLAVALKAGATKAVFDRTLGIHPTAAEEFVTMRTPLPEA
jgi:glutathione reductase (NADPH)